MEYMILEQIKLGTPLLWIKTEDIDRINDFVINSKIRDFYSIIPNLGFSKLVDKTWKPVLVDFPNPDDGSITQDTTYDFVVAYQHLKKTNETMSSIAFIHSFYTDPKSFLEAYGPIMSSFNHFYRNSFFADDVTLLPMQNIFISSFDCPEEYASIFSINNSEPLSIGEMLEILNHFATISDNLFVEDGTAQDIARSALGLSESVFINLCLLSIIKNKVISSKYIYDTKMSKIKQSGILEIIKPKMTFDNIGGLDNAKDIIKKNVWLWNNPEEAKKFGVQPIRRILMVGVPGTGKSAICEATANELGLDLARTGVSQVMNSFVGQSEANMRAVFNQIKVMAPLCVWIDEFGRDMSGGQSSSHVDGGTTDRVHGEFLTGLQELPENVFLICAANQIENLKPEMLRAERFDKIIFVGLPSQSERKEIINIHLSSIKTDHDWDLDALAEATTGFTGAEIKSLIKETNFFVVSSELRTLNTNDILIKAPKMRNILWNKNRDSIIGLYKSAIEQWDFASSSQLEDASKVISGNYTSRGTAKPTPQKSSW
jgi:ATP-dependent 26S proteasome regulatory subunit